MQAQPNKFSHWGRIGDGSVLVVFATIVLWTIRYHEKWADEAQAWLIARDLGLRSIWFHELRYEGSPGLWHTILWVTQHVFHAKYGALGYIGAGFAIAGAAVLIFHAPFPRYIRWPLALTYVMVYQYAVIARPYTLLPLLAFCAAMFFKGLQHPQRITLVLILLALLTLHGAILAGCLGLAFMVQAAKIWPALDAAVRTKYWICISAMVCVFVGLFYILKPTPDVEEFLLREQLARAAPGVREQLPSVGQKLVSVISGAFVDWFAASLILLVLLGAWSIWRRKGLAFVLPVALLLALYAAVHGYAHHHGTLFVAAITGLWIAWPSSTEKLSFQLRERFGLMGVEALLLILCAVNIWDACVVIKREYVYPYSGANDAVNYLKAVGAEHSKMFGYLHGITAVQAYFDHNMFANVTTSYIHHGLPLRVRTLNVEELNAVRPEYIVAYSDEPQSMMQTGAKELQSQGYELMHFSDGYQLYKRGVYERETYFIFRRSPQLRAGSTDGGANGLPGASR
jgi:hypothetical protein